MQSIHNNLSAGAQNVTGAYVIIMLVYRRLLTSLAWCVARPLFLAQGVIACSISARTQKGRSGMVRQADLFLTPTRFCR